MKLKIPCANLTKNVNDIIALSHQFLVDCEQSNDILIIEADEDALLDFLTAYHNIDVQAAKETMSKYNDVSKPIAKRSFTPEESLQKINEFILSKGGFDGYDEMFESLSNAINGMI